MDWTLEKGGKVPTHLHKHMDEHFLVTKGEVTFRVNKEKIVKKTGEELFVPKMTPHSILNNTNETIGLTVTYTPCSDTHRMFEIIARVDPEGKGSPVNMLKYFYIAKRTGLKEFSEIQPPFAMKLIHGLISIVGTIGGWRKLI